jgi:small acid-soluble spore protein F (minor alpha/beta-type SASP)
MGRRRRGLMSESLKTELAKDLGFYSVVQKEGWENIRAKDAGNLVKRAIQIAETHLAKQQQGVVQPVGPTRQPARMPYRP